MKGILFKEPLFNAILECRKSQTRRLIKQVPPDYDFKYVEVSKDLNTAKYVFTSPVGEKLKIKPRYNSEDLVYMKEPFAHKKTDNVRRVIYKYRPCSVQDPDQYKWKNKLFMPSLFARFYIIIEKVSVQRVLDVTPGEAVEEGIIDPYDISYYDPKYHQQEFLRVFHHINKVPLNRNPWVFAYYFRPINCGKELLNAMEMVSKYI